MNDPFLLNKCFLFRGRILIFRGVASMPCSSFIARQIYRDQFPPVGHLKRYSDDKGILPKVVETLRLMTYNKLPKFMFFSFFSFGRALLQPRTPGKLPVSFWQR